MDVTRRRGDPPLTLTEAAAIARGWEMSPAYGGYISSTSLPATLASLFVERTRIASGSSLARVFRNISERISQSNRMRRVGTCRDFEPDTGPAVSKTRSGRIGGFFVYCVSRLLVAFIRAGSDLFSVAVGLKHKFLFMSLNSASPAKQWQIIRNGSEDTRKAIPKHVCLAVVESTMISFEDISRLAVWLHALGVKFISFFDTSNALHRSPENLREQLQGRLFECRRPRDSIILLQPGEDVANVDAQASRSVACVLDANDGREKLGIVIGKILNEAVRAKENSLKVADINYNVKEIESQLSVAGAGFPDPECVLFFGPVNSAMKFLPWQLNHAEIIKMDSHHSMLPSQLLQALERYTRIERRFGK